MAINSYKPGQGVRIAVSVLQSGVPTDANTMVITVHGPDGTTLTPAVVHDGAGAYHADAALPFSPPAASGQWTYRAQALGGTAAQNALVEGNFLVVPLSF